MHSRDDIQIMGYTLTNFGGYFGTGDWNLTKVYSELPKEICGFVFSGLYLFGNIEDWAMDWQP